MNLFTSFDAKHVVLIALVVTAALYDIKSRRIPNWLVAIGLILSAAFSVESSGAQGLTTWGGGLLVGFGLFIPIYILRAMGAGDVKLMVMVGSFLGAGAALDAVLLTLLTGGGLALFYAFIGGRLRTLYSNVRFMAMDLTVKVAIGETPYAT